MPVNSIFITRFWGWENGVYVNSQIAFLGNLRNKRIRHAGRKKNYYRGKKTSLLTQIHIAVNGKKLTILLVELFEQKKVQDIFLYLHCAVHLCTKPKWHSEDEGEKLFQTFSIKRQQKSFKFLWAISSKK